MKLLGSLCLLVLCVGISSQNTTAQAAPAPSASPAAAQATPATQTTQYTLPPEKLAKSKALYDLRGKLRIIDTVYGLLILLGLLYFGVAARYRDWAEAAGKNRFVQALIFVALFLVTTTALQLPLDAYQQSISRQYGLSVQGWGSWFGDVLKGMLVGYVFLTIVAWVMATLIRVSPRRWWLYSWAIIFGLVVFIVAISPVVIDPLFNKFEPLDQSNPQLVDAIEKVTQRGGLTIPRDRMFLMKASEKVTTLNAYVTGFGPSKRVVVWDTTIKNATTPETLFVYGHEMGHYVLNHIVIGLTAAAVGLFIGFYLLYHIANWAFARYKERWRMHALYDWAALVMLLLIFSIMATLSAPIGNGFSRQLEHNADIYGLEVTHGINPNPQEAAAHAFQVLGELSLSYPYPSRFVVFWYADHPPICDRVPFAHNYDPWSKGEQPKYVK
ncbi:MAG TPA: M48 family metallopeptidase [Candidatus Angelobacter sp.]|nr:M48 family metallopeptidase [Candidatus Angelobacter sp.]